MQTWVALLDTFYFGEVFTVAELVLRDRFVPVLVVHEGGLTSHAEQLLQLGKHGGDECFGIGGRAFGLALATDKGGK